MLLLETTSNSSTSAASSPPSSTTSSSTSAANSTTVSTLSGLTMLTSGANQYIQPDYLSPMPTTLDAKRSPLALLAQTCSQIGADPLPTSNTSTSSTMLTSTTSVSSMSKAPQEKSVVKKADSEKSRKTPPVKHDEKSGFKSPKTTSVSTSLSPSSVTVTSSAFTPSTDTKLSEAQKAALDALTLQQHQLAKDTLSASLGAYRPMFASMPSLPAMHPYHMAGLDPATAAALGAFRHPAAAYPSHLYPPTSLGLSLAYQQALSSYGRLPQHPMGKSEVCRDPYCTGCPSNPAPSSASPSCPAGCNQCDHVKATAASAATSTATSSTTTSTASLSPSLASSRPYVCNWIAADQYCGKRFTSSEELLQHLRTHTSLAVPPADALTSSTYSSLMSPSLAHSHLLASSAAAAALHRTYPTPPLSPLSMARYHPYSKPATPSPLSAAPPAIGVPTSTAGAPPAPNPLLSLHNPYAGLGAYYSHPYSLYSQRMLAGAGVLP